jgi:hypothetical protein
VLLTLIQPSIEIWNLQVDEPITTLTDLLLATVSFYAFVRIGRHGERSRIQWYFRYYFLTLGLGAMTGGLLGHAFLYRLAPGWKLISWVLAIISVALMIHAMVEMSKPLLKARFTRLIILINWVIMPAAVFLTLRRLSFSPVKFYTIYGMLVVVGSLSLFSYIKTGGKGVARFLLAVSLGLVSALIFSKQWGFSPWFNHNDISHTILAISAVLIYKGVGLVMRIQAPPTPVGKPSM